MANTSHARIMPKMAKNIFQKQKKFTNNLVQSYQSLLCIKECYPDQVLYRG
jgi:hypothetical protein